MIPPILRPHPDNLPGACYLQLVPVGSVVVGPVEVNGAVPEAITVSDPSDWVTVQPTRYTQVLTEEWVMVNGARMARARIEAEVPKDRVALLHELYELGIDRYLVLHHDLNSTVKLLGTQNEPAIVRVERLQHGRGGAGTDGNLYLLVVEVTRRRMCPFYLADPPDPTDTGTCPTLAELVAAATWATIEGVLSEGQVADAVESICPTLCTLLDGAITAGEPGTGAVVSGAGESAVNGTYAFDTVVNGRNSYINGPYQINWSGSAWYISDGSMSWYTSTDDVSEPWEVTTWTAEGWSSPMPTVAQEGTAGDASAVTACLSPEQSATLLAALLGSMTGGDIWDALSTGTQAEVLTAAGVTTLDEVNDEEPYGSYTIDDI